MNSNCNIGIVFETHDTYPPSPGAPADHAAEYEPLEIIEALESAFATLGHHSFRLGSPLRLLEMVGSGSLPPVDAVLSVAEGFGSRNREGWAGALLEMADVPLLGSDALTLSTSLDKVWTLDRVASAGVRVAEYCAVHAPEELARCALPPAPWFVKPRCEGTAKGITAASRCADRAALAAAVERVCARYDQPALIESFLSGAEYTVTVVGHDPPRALPVLQRAIEAETRIGVHALEGPGAGRPPAGGYRAITPGSLDASLEAELAEQALRAFDALECRDFARLDFKLDEKGVPHFLEINPLPTFAVDGSFGILAELAGRSYASFVGEILGEALSRLGLGVAAGPGVERAAREHA